MIVQVRLQQILKEQGNAKATMAESMLKMQMKHVGSTEKVNQQKGLLEWTQVCALYVSSVLSLPCTKRCGQTKSFVNDAQVNAGKT